MDYLQLEISPGQAEALALQYYGIKGKAKALMGEVDFNFHLRAEDGKEYTLKLSRPDADSQSIDFQAALMKHLSREKIPLNFPEVIISLDGKEYIELDQHRFLRLQKWVPGRMLDEAKPCSPTLLQSWGHTCGLLSRHLKNFDHPAAHRFYRWDPSETLYSKKYLPYFQEDTEKELANYFWDIFEQLASPLLPELRKSVNYNDAHVHNLLINSDYKNPRVTGVIDFGDALYTQTVNELAIACAYAGMNFPNPLEAVCHVVKSYHACFPLSQKEIKVLFPLLCARLMNTVANAAWNKHQEPDNKYLLISEKPAWEVLKKWRTFPPSFVHYTFRQVCGIEPCPDKLVFQEWVNKNAVHFAPVIASESNAWLALDLSVGSTDLGNNSNFEEINIFQKTIDRLLEDKVGIGGYGEVRPFYTTDAYQVEGNNGAQWRTVHLGIDIWAKGGTAVNAPLEGVVHSFQNNAGDCNYGPTIILEHQVNEHLSFFSLYGHLSSDSLERWKEGQLVKKGQKIAEIGSPPENGNWPAHLHFQIILDMLGNRGDFPGVAYPDERSTWLSICPDPAPFFSKSLKTNSHPTRESILQKRKNILGKSLSISYEEPLHMVRGYKQYLYDSRGRRYLDTVNNVAHVGHQHPRVVEAAQKQIGLLNTNTRYLHNNIIQFAEDLLSTFPSELCVVHFVNSGSEANELALRMMQACTGQKDMIAVEVGYHGNTGACIDVSSYKFDGKGGKGAPLHTHIVPIPDIYRGMYRNAEGAGKRYAAHVKKKVEKIRSLGRSVGGFICESIMSCGGQIVLPEGYLEAAYSLVRSAGGLCIADEVQVGFGRVGEKFWGFELQGVVPDIVTMGKPIGNGHPLAAVVTTKEVADSFANGMEYFNTFGGNPVSCAIGREVLSIIKDEGLQQHAADLGIYLMQGLKKLHDQFPILGDVRGQGLFLGFELVKNRKSLAPAAEQTAYLANRMRERGILMSTDGPFHNVIKIKPPMCFDRSNADYLLKNLEIVLGEDFMQV